jgi:uncharacterized protein (TIGR00270 family)
MACDVCGDMEDGYVVLIEGARMNTCQECASLGRIISTPVRYSPAARVKTTKQELEMVENFGEEIQKGMKRTGLPVAVLAERINEKVSFLERVVNQKTLPGEHLARKLEHELGIKLLVPASSGEEKKPSGGGGKEMTLGDVLELQKKKKGDK